MLSAVDLERLITVKKLEIEKEKTFLGLSSPDGNDVKNEQCRASAHSAPDRRARRSVSFSQSRDLSDHAPSEEKEEGDGATAQEQDEIPADLERYIRRYLGLPVMLKAGEYSPNNPLVRGERCAGDALLGLGEYERRRNTLRRLRQQQYRDYLDQQAKKKQEEKEQAEKERREREAKEREREEREREREREEREREREERERRRGVAHSPDRRRASVSYVGNLSYNKVDTGVQVDRRTAPLSVAVQTDDSDLFRLPQSPSKSQLTQAERELSPRTVGDVAPWPHKWADTAERRRSYGDFDERSSSLVRKSNRDKLTADLRHSYMPSIFDADAIQLRNMQAEKEALARRQDYQAQLRDQIREQQRLREERKTREKLLEAAEMRRLEEQLRMLRAAQDGEVSRQQGMDRKIKEDNIEYDKKRKELQKEIDNEQIKLIRAPLSTQPLRRLPTSRSDTDTKLPFYYPLLQERTKNSPLLHEAPSESAYFKENPKYSLFQERSSPLLQDRKEEKKPFSTNIPDDSIFSPNYDVDGYLRRNLNFKALELKSKDLELESLTNTEDNIDKVRELPKVTFDRKPIPKERKSINQQESLDSLPIPVLRHSPVSQLDRVESGSDLSDAMKKVDDKWKVPVVQKNILKSIPNDEGKNVSILTQLGSIRRQLQLEQLKLDKLSKGDE